MEKYGSIDCLVNNAGWRKCMKYYIHNDYSTCESIEISINAILKYWCDDIWLNNFIISIINFVYGLKHIEKQRNSV